MCDGRRAERSKPKTIDQIAVVGVLSATVGEGQLFRTGEDDLDRAPTLTIFSVAPATIHRAEIQPLDSRDAGEKQLSGFQRLRKTGRKLFERFLRQVNKLQVQQHLEAQALTGDNGGR